MMIRTAADGPVVVNTLRCLADDLKAGGMDKAAAHVQGMIDEIQDAQTPLCNLCGETTNICDGDDGYKEAGGLINAGVSGGYSSTPGNGHGALDDGTACTFSLCEFCCDWLMSQFKIPPRVTYYMGTVDEYSPVETFRPAAVRVAEDDWREMKDEFFKEKARRDALRGARVKETL